MSIRSMTERSELSCYALEYIRVGGQEYDFVDYALGVIGEEIRHIINANTERTNHYYGGDADDDGTKATADQPEATNYGGSDRECGAGGGDSCAGGGDVAGRRIMIRR